MALVEIHVHGSFPDTKDIMAAIDDLRREVQETKDIATAATASAASSRAVANSAMAVADLAVEKFTELRAALDAAIANGLPESVAQEFAASLNDAQTEIAAANAEVAAANADAEEARAKIATAAGAAVPPPVVEPPPVDEV